MNKYLYKRCILLYKYWCIEIGDRNKGRKQLAGVADAWVVKDDLEYPTGRSLPLWLFGFLY